MEEKKALKISLSTFFLILAIIVICVMVYYIYKLNNEKIAIAVEEAFKNLNKIDENDTNGLIHLGLEFALTANAYINISKRILYLVRAYQTIDNNKKKKKYNEEKEN